MILSLSALYREQNMLYASALHTNKLCVPLELVQLLLARSELLISIAFTYYYWHIKQGGAH